MSRFSKLQILSSFLSLIIYLPFINADTKDSCAVVSATVPTGQNTFGSIAQCLCENTVPEAIATNPTLSEFAAFVGESDAEQQLDTLITSSPSVQVCHYPDNSIPACTISNVCAFTCSPGNSLCSNGNCRRNCPSDDNNDHRRRDQLPMPTAAPACPANQQMCRYGRTFKCVDTQNDLVSCGGCMYAKLSERGRDCSEIPGVDVVSCDRGVCNVQSCIKDYTFNPDTRTCSFDG